MYSLVYDCKLCGAKQDRTGLVCDCGALRVDGLSPGAVICGRYRYLATIGSGGMGLIVKAYDSREDCDVALKMLLRNNNASEVTRFMQECRATANLSHRCIITAKEYGVTDDGYPYMAMEYLSGEDLTTRISRQGALDMTEALDIFYQLCDTMSYAHSKGIVHRDLKPSNIMLQQLSTGKQQIKIVDFGIAKVVYSDEMSTQSDLTRTGQIIGSPLYMSPEQALGKKIDFRTDIYSAGCVIYHALTGAPPIHGESAIETLFKHVHEIPPKMSEASLGRKFSPALEQLVAKALKKDPDERFQSFDQLKQALISAQQNKITVETQPHQLTSTGGKKQAKRAVLLTLAGMLFVVSSCLAAALFVSKAKESGHNQAKVSLPPPPITTSDNSQERDLNDRDSALNIAADQAFTRGLKSMIDYDVDSLNWKIDIGQASVTDEDVAYLLRRLKSNPRSKCTSLSMRNSAVTDKALKMLADSHSPFKSLDLSRTKITGEGLKVLARIPSLEQLSIESDHNINPKAFAYLGNLKRLDELDMSNLAYKDVDEQDFSFLSKLLLLKHLRMDSCKNLPVHLFKFAERLPQLETLSVCSSAIGDESLEDIGHIDSLEELYIERNKITDKGIDNLTGLTGLTTLECGGNKITKAAFPALTKMANLTKIKFDRSGKSQADIYELRNKMRNTTFDLSAMHDL